MVVSRTRKNYFNWALSQLGTQSLHGAINSY